MTDRPHIRLYRCHFQRSQPQTYKNDTNGIDAAVALSPLNLKACFQEFLQPHRQLQGCAACVWKIPKRITGQ